MRRVPGGENEGGFSFLGLMVVVAIMLIMMTVALPSWDYIIRRDKEEELLFRGCEIADAIAAFQAERGGPPPSLDALVKGKFLRKAYTDPMTKDGKWRLIRPGEAAATAGPAGTVPVQAVPVPSPSSFGPHQSVGPIAGVASMSEEKSLMRVNKQFDHYNQWRFIPGQPIVAGRKHRCGPRAQVVTVGSQPSR